MIFQASKVYVIPSKSISAINATTKWFIAFRFATLCGMDPRMPVVGDTVIIGEAEIKKQVKIVRACMTTKKLNPIRSTNLFLNFDNLVKLLTQVLCD